jgi:hypothetical protein
MGGWQWNPPYDEATTVPFPRGRLYYWQDHSGGPELNRNLPEYAIF